MANITLSAPSFFSNGTSGASAVVGYESGYNRVARYSFTSPSTGATSVSLSFINMWHGGGTATSFRFYIGTSADSHINAGAGSTYTGTIKADAGGTNFTGTANVLLQPNKTYYLFVFPASATYGWYNWNGSAAMSTSGGSYSVPTVSASTVVMGDSVTIYTNRNSDTFTHDLSYTFGGITGTIASNVGASYAWTVPDLVAKIPNALSGTCTITCKTKSGSTVIGSSTCTLTLTVPAKSTPTLSAASVQMGSAVRIYTNRKSTGFTHKISYAFGTESVEINSGVTDSCSWTPIIDLASQIPNSKTGTATITCATYNGTALVGSSTATLILTVPDNENTKPTVEMTLSPVSSLGSAFNGLYIQNLTKLSANVTASGKYKASIKATETLVGGSKYNGGYLTQTGNVTVTGKATDSRGYVGTIEKTITVIPYSKPAVLPADGQKAIICGRCNENGSYTETGTYLRIIAKRSYSTITANGVQKNFSTLRYRINGGEWKTLLSRSSTANQIDTAKIDGVTLSLTSSYSVEIGVVDDIGNSASVTFRIPTDKVDVHFREGGGGVAVGGYSTKEGFECAMPAFFTGGVQGNNLMGRYVAEIGDNLVFNAGVSCLGSQSNAGLLLILDTADPSRYVLAYYHYVVNTSNTVNTIASNNLTYLSNVHGTVSARDSSGNSVTTARYVVMPCFAL